MNQVYVKEITAWTEIDGDGQKVTAAIVAYDTEINGTEIRPQDFDVKNRHITVAYTSREPVPGHRSHSGNYVVLELDKTDAEASTIEHLHVEHGIKIHIKPAELEVRQHSDLQSVSGDCVPKTTYQKSSRAVDPVADQFHGFVFDVPKTDKQLAYNLFIPKEAKETNKKYPLVLFMHDWGSCSDDLTAALAQGNGAVIWALDEEQQKHPCFVLAPRYPDKTAEDDFTVTWEADATVELIRSLLQSYPVDETRIYGTGQSMGCMMLCELNIRNPHFFAASFLVAGQWNPNTMAAAKDEYLWALVSEGDAKGFPNMGACMDAMEAAGEKVTRGSINAKAPVEEQNQMMKELAAQGNHLLFTWYEGDSVLPEGIKKSPVACHLCTWKKAYSIDAVHDWLFAQRLTQET